MGTIARGFKNAFRNSIRTLSIIFILAVSISMALVMLMALKTVQSKINSVKGSIGNYITISPAGIRGFEGGGNLLTDQNVTDVTAVEHVTKTVRTLEDRVTPGTDTNLQSAIDAGSFGNRQRQRESSQTGSSGTQNRNQTFAMPVMITGTNDLSATATLNVSQFNITSGDKFDGATSENVAIIGNALASKNNLSIGSTFQAYSKDVKVVGIFDGGNTFANASAIMPITALQNLSSQSGQISSIIAQTDSIDNVQAVETAIKAKFDDKADVTSQQDSSNNAVKPLENIKTISLYSLIGALGGGAIIIFLTMVMIVRERRREIGVLKAIGASNFLIVSQFTVEALVLTLTSSIVGMILGLALSNPVLNVLVNNSTSSSASTGGAGARGAGQAALRFGANFAGGAQSAVRSLHAAVGTDIILYGLGVAILIAIIGSAIPAYTISKVRPAAVLRSE